MTAEMALIWMLELLVANTGNSLFLADVAGFTMALAYRRNLDWRPERALVQW
jgi:hypothetical protein